MYGWMTDVGWVQVNEVDADAVKLSLLKSFVIMYRRRRLLMSRADVDTLLTLMSVCHVWTQLVNRLLTQLRTLVVRGAPVSPYYYHHYHYY